MTQKRMTRKELRRPDEFFAFTERAWTFLRENRWAMIVGSGATAMVILAVSLWVYLAQTRAEEGTLQLGKALDTYNRMVVAPQDEAQAAEAESAAAGEGPRFNSLTEKLSTAAEQFSALQQTRGRSGAGSIAVLLRAGTSYDQGEYEKAVADCAAFLARGRQPELRQMAVEMMGYAYEGLGQWAEASKAFERLRVENAAGDGALAARYHQARILARQGMTAEAESALRQVIADARSGNGSPDLVERAEQQLALLIDR